MLAFYASRHLSFSTPQAAVLQHLLACCLTTPWIVCDRSLQARSSHCDKTALAAPGQTSLPDACSEG